jgi:hypothetical protein
MPASSVGTRCVASVAATQRGPTKKMRDDIGRDAARPYQDNA